MLNDRFRLNTIVGIAILSVMIFSSLLVAFRPSKLVLTLHSKESPTPTPAADQVYSLAGKDYRCHGGEIGWVKIKTDSPYQYPPCPEYTTMHTGQSGDCFWGYCEILITCHNGILTSP